MGFAILDGYSLLCTGAGLEPQYNPIYSSAVWGAGWRNAAQITNVAENAFQFEGPVNFDFQGDSVLFTLMKNWALEDRAYSRTLVYSPDGNQIYKFVKSSPKAYDDQGVWCSAITWSASQDSPVTCAATAIGLNRTQTTTGGFGQYIDNTGPNTGAGDLAGAGAPVNPLNPSQTNRDPLPYWKTIAQIQDRTTGNPPTQWANCETVDWSITHTNNTQVLYTMDGTQAAFAVLQGTIDATGDVTLFRHGGFTDHDAIGRVPENTQFKVILDQGVNIAILLPYVNVESTDYGVRGQNDVVSRGFSLHGLGDGTLRPIEYTTAS